MQLLNLMSEFDQSFSLILSVVVIDMVWFKAQCGGKPVTQWNQVPNLIYTVFLFTGLRCENRFSDVGGLFLLPLFVSSLFCFFCFVFLRKSAKKNYLLLINFWNSSVQSKSMWKWQALNNVKWDLLYVSASADLRDLLCLCLSPCLPRSHSALSLSTLPPLPALHFVEGGEKKSAAEKNTSLLNFKTTLMCAAANSLWLKNLPNFLVSEGRAENQAHSFPRGQGEEADG